jgi:hypothetical protein
MTLILTIVALVIITALIVLAYLYGFLGGFPSTIRSIRNDTISCEDAFLFEMPKRSLVKDLVHYLQKLDTKTFSHKLKARCGHKPQK